MPGISFFSSVIKNLPEIQGLIPGSGRSPGEGNGNPLQYSCLENPMDEGAWWATVHMVTKSQTRLKRLRTNALKENHQEFLSLRVRLRRQEEQLQGSTATVT